VRKVSDEKQNGFKVSICEREWGLAVPEGRDVRD